MSKPVVVEKGKSSEQESATKGVPYTLYAAIIGLIIGGNFFRVATQDMSWTFGIYGSNACWFFLALASALFGFFAAPRFKASIPPLMAVLVCGVVGGVLTILTNSTTGVIAGLIGASFSINEKARRVFIAFFVRWLFPSVLVAGITGAVAALLFVNLRCRTSYGELMTTLPWLIVGLIALQRVLRTTLSKRQLSAWFAAVPLFLVLAVVSFFLTMTADLNRRDRAMKNVRSRASYITMLAGMGNSKFTSEVAQATETLLRPFYFRQLTFEPGSDCHDARLASAFPRIVSLSVTSGSTITDDDFALLDTRFLQGIDVSFGNKLTGESIQMLDASQLGGVKLRGRQFGEDTLANFTSTPQLWLLDLPATGVTSDAFRNFDPVAPVWQIDLSYTLIDDEVLQYFAKLPRLNTLNLRGTKVNGHGLSALRGKRLYTLDLSETSVEEEQLLQMRPSSESMQFPTILLGLSLANVPLGDDGFAIVSQFAELQRLDVSGSKISPQAWSSLMNLIELTKLSISASELTPERLADLSLNDLTLVVDGRQGFALVREQVVELSRRFSLASRTDGPTRQTAIGIRIDNLKLDRPTTEKLSDLYDETKRDGPFLTLRNALLPDGVRTDIDYPASMVDFFKKQIQ